MQRKLIQVGTSAAVLIPKSVMVERGMRIGDMVEIEVVKKGKSIPKTDIDPEVVQWTNHFIEKYRPLLKKLAKL